MSEARRDLDLPQEPLGADRGCELAPEHLDRHLAVVLPVLREVHGRHAAATELAANGVTVRERRGEGGVRFGHSRGNMPAPRHKREGRSVIPVTHLNAVAAATSHPPTFFPGFLMRGR